MEEGKYEEAEAALADLAASGRFRNERMVLAGFSDGSGAAPANLALSLGMVGALSIIRFRSAVKDPRDISYIFWSVAMGLAAGTGIHLLAICGSLALGVFVLVFTLLGHPRHTLMLILKGRGLDAEAVRDQVFRLTGRARLRMQDIAPNGTEFIYDVRLKKDMSGEAVAKALSGIAGVETVHLVAGSEEP